MEKPKKSMVGKMRTVGRAQSRHERGYLPHWEAGGRTYFVTFAAMEGEKFSPEERAAVMECVRFGHPARWWLHGAVVMPEHVHMLVTPVELNDGGSENECAGIQCAGEVTRAPSRGESSGAETKYLSVGEIVKSVKGVSARRINRLRGRRGGSIWQTEYYDRQVRDRDDFEVKMRYMINNPVKRGLVKDWREWPDLFIGE